MNRFLKIFSKGSKEEKARANKFFETTLEEQLESDKSFFATEGLSRTKSTGSGVDAPFKTNIPTICQKFIQFFYSHIAVPGIFRTTGSLAKVRRLKQVLCDYQYELRICEEHDVPTIASCFKLWLRDLKDGIVPKSYFSKLVEASADKVELKKVLKRLPKPNFDTLEYILEFLLELSAHSDINKMTVSNIAIVFGPCLVRINASDDQLDLVMKETVTTTDMIKLIMEEFEFLFDKPLPKKIKDNPEDTLIQETIEINLANETAHLNVQLNSDEDSVSSVITEANSPLNTKQKLVLDTIMASTIEGIISGSSAIQQRNKSLLDGFAKSLVIQKSLTADDALILIPTEVSKKETKPDRKGLFHTIPNAPNRPAPCPPEENNQDKHNIKCCLSQDLSLSTEKLSIKSEKVLQDSKAALQNALNRSKSSLDLHIPTHIQKRAEKEIFSKDNTIAFAKKNIKKNGLAKVDANDTIFHEISKDETRNNGILNYIIEAEQVPPLSELSKSDIHQVKALYKMLHDQVNLNNASSTDILKYKKLREVIKSWQAAMQIQGIQTNTNENTNEEIKSKRNTEHQRKKVDNLQKSNIFSPNTTLIPPYDDDDQGQCAFHEKRSRKRKLQLLLHTYQKTFEQKNGRPIKSAQDIEPMKKEYAEYKELKREIELLRSKDTN